LFIVKKWNIAIFFKALAAFFISVHIEATNHLHRLIHQIKDTGAKASVALNPHTPVHTLEEILPYVDMILVMSVNPGFGGQKFIETSVNKVAKLNKLRQEHNYNFLIEVDGGVNLDTGKLLTDAGTDVLVAGSFIFKRNNNSKNIESLKKL